MFYRGHSKFIEYLVILNAFMFIVRLAAEKFVFTYLALTPAHVLYMPWTLITSMFIHADFWHILLNMLFGVMMFGSHLEDIIGVNEFRKVYFLGGLAAGLFYVAMSLLFWLPPPMTAAVGASGAIFAVIGALIILRPNIQIYVYMIFPMPLWLFGLLYILYAMFAIPIDATGNVAVTAHLGGLFAGLIMGWIYKNKPQKTAEYITIRYY